MLLQAHQEWRKNQVQQAGEKLRDAIQYAIFAWHAIWYPIKECPTDWLVAASAIGEGIPGFNKKQFTIPKKSKPDTERVFSRLLLLKDLNKLANPFHHHYIGNMAVYTRDDVDLLLTSTTAALRNLPAFWSAFPSPIVVIEHET